MHGCPLWNEVLAMVSPALVLPNSLLSKASLCLEVSKLWNHPERRGRRSNGFSDLLDTRRRSVPKESRAFANVHDSVGLESHQSRAGCVSGYRIIRKHDSSQSTSGAVRGPLPSLATMPSAMTRWIGMVAHRSRMLS